MIPYLLAVPPAVEPHELVSFSTDLRSCGGCAALSKCFAGILGKADSSALDAVISGRRRIARHQSLYKRGERLANLFQVRYGQFKVVGLDPMGEQRVIGFHMAGDLIGLDSLATGRHQFRAVALEDCEVCEIPYTSLEQAMSAAPSVRRQFIQVLGQYSINESVNFMSHMRSEQRLGYFLLSLSSRYAELGYSSKSFRLSMSRADIGSYLGITAESVSRLIGRFKDNGWIEVRHRDVEIADRAQLQLLLLRADHGAGSAAAC